jgi:hypothetical protein
VGLTLDGYPAPCGYSKISVFWHAGPASYTQATIVAGTVPATGGDTINAQAEAGLKYFDWVGPGETDDGAFSVRAIPAAVSNGARGAGAPCTTYVLQWVSKVTATVGGKSQTAGQEAVAATNLSSEIVRFLAFGPK